VYNNTVVNNRHGIFLDKGCQSIDIIDNKVCNSSQSGIRVNGSTDVRIDSNEVYQNTFNGIWGNSSIHLDIRNNTVYDDELGIWLRNSNSSQVIGNVLFGNDNAMWISNQSNSNNIAFNRIFDPADLNPNTCGIHLSHNAHENNFLVNTVSNSTEHGFYVEASSGNNTIKWNTFSGNNIGGTSQAFDAASVNVLYNYWSDWTTPDANFDQIVDLPYALEGAAMNEDPFPLTQSANTSTSHFLLPIAVLYPNGGESITDSVTVQWTPSYDSEDHAVNYSIYVSDNSGTDWRKIAGNLTTNQYEWNTSTELKTTHYLIRVTAECSSNLTVFDESDGEFSLIAHTLSELTITSPTSSGPFNTSLMIEWDAAVDSWGWIVSYSIQYSSTGGYSWNDLTSGLTGNSYQWDISQLDEDDTYVVKIVASADGGVASEAISVLFSIRQIPATPTGGGDMIQVLAGVGIAGVAVVIILVIFLKKRSAVET
jgi:parallel beta-helix repeat protein